MSAIIYQKGDATNVAPNTIIAHITNNCGVWGAGFVMAISRRWPSPEKAYLESAAHGVLALGSTEFVTVNIGSGGNVIVANMCAQDGFPSVARPVAVDYDHLESCLAQTFRHAKANGMSVAMPRIGCGIAGGKWEEVELRIKKALLDYPVPVTVYDF